MLVRTAIMLWMYLFVILSVVANIYCENWLHDDHIENHQVQFKHQQQIQTYYGQSSNGQENINLKTAAHRSNRFVSDEAVATGAEAAMAVAVAPEPIPLDDDDGSKRKNMRRPNLRRRKMGSSHKKSIFRRGQRHRHNKNGFQVVSDDADNRDVEEQMERIGLWPPVVNVAPRAILHANATCGQHHREEFCHTIDAHPQRQRKPKCSVCDSHDVDRRHPIEYVIDGSQKWWQSPNLNSGAENEYITITMDLKQNYQVIHVSLKSAISPRPAAWILERSFDGVDFFPWQYFGMNDDDCRKRYNLRGQNEPYTFESDDQIICSTEFAKAVPLENGEIHLKLLEGRPGIKSKITPTTLLDFTLARYLRLRFQGLHTTHQTVNGIQWLVDRDELKKRSFYSLKYIKIGARLDCNGHAQRPKQYNDDEIIECDCAHNTCGINCEKCCPLYNQKPYKQGTSTDSNKCEKCECHGHSNECYYNPEVDQRGLSLNTDGVYSGGGVCLNCTDLTTGINCEKCMNNYFRPFGVSPNVKEPCISCECNPIGTIGVCANIGGACTCKPGFVGPKCAECAQGYSGPNCTRCACDSRGTMPGGECESHCQCKLYAEGELCDKCVPGFFGLSQSNPEGCTKCYCSGVGNNCESSNIMTNPYETMEDWKITDISRSFILHPSRDNETGFLVFNMYEMSESVYWLAPDLYCGNKLQSYGSNLVFTISWIVVRGDTSGKPTFCPTVILIGANGLKIAYGDSLFSETNSTISVQFTEHGWYQLPQTIDSEGLLQSNDYRGDYISRSHFLSVLSNIESVMLRGSFHTDQAESILIRASLEYSKSNKNELRSNLVEQCTCPQGYTGLSCESCDFGYVRAYENITAGEQLGICLPCSCNGHAETCDLTTNKCSECTHNTTDERCGSCAEGFYGNAKMGTPVDCKRCACPLIDDTNNFSPACQLRDSSFEHQNEVTSDYSLISYQNNDYVCTQCPEGYIGDHCESCADGYYGVPTKPLSKCLKCPCNGGPCDPISGKCVTCQGNTEGWRCEQCKTGYFGNPAKGCELCRCQGIGSQNNECDRETGQCKCKKNYDGYQCDECAFGYANITLGCVACGCNSSGSIENFCDTHTGQCPCKMGVEGLQCNECVEGFYGLSTDGCQECHCNPLGSLAQICNKHNGQCVCRENVSGRACDRCSEGFWNLESKNGCQSCACNAIGSINFTCNAYTGQCNCKPGVTGSTCDSCLEGHYGFSVNGCKRCDECSNSAFNCDPETGRCVCPPHSKGIDCNQCMPNSYGWEHKKGCKLCDCDHIGSIGQSCDLFTGQCLCREGFTGRQCNRCSIGYFGHPNCERCNCNRDGSLIANETEPIACNDVGQCPCKALVTGTKCDECVESTFGLSQYNDDGCTRCFCFGRSNVCVQSDFSWGLIKATDKRCLNVDYQNIEYVSLQARDNTQAFNYETNLQFIDGLTVIPGTSGNVSMKSSRGFEMPLYFEMPKQFLGDRLLSYGGHFKFTIEMMECETELDQITVKHFPLVRINAHDSLTLDYFWPEAFHTSSNVTQSVRMIEQHWRVHPSGETVSRGLFMAALQNITHIFIRGASSVAFTSLTLFNVTMETAIFISGTKNNLAIGVEVCECPNTYEGTSCQNPADGYYRYRYHEKLTETTQLSYEQYIGKSMPCECSGRSNQCNKETGYCENCANSTGGANCEICAEGYYGDPDDFGCQSCPCPETHRNFAKGCTFFNGRVSCSCRPGYIGDYCDACAPGYYGSPEQEGGGCIECKCNQLGSVSIECDALSGECMCKDGIIGKRCDKCVQPISILEIGGCQVCDNCTITLLESSKDLDYYVQSETRQIDLDSVPAPWSRLLSYENATEHLIIRLDDILKTTEKIENYNDLQVDKLNSKGSNLQSRWQKMQTKAVKRSQMSDNLRTIASTFFNELEYVRNETQEHINMLNAFGIGAHHVHLPIALAESEQLLKRILTIVDSHNVAHRAHQCAVYLIDQWSNTSAILTSQFDESMQLKYDTINVKNRLYDLIQNVYKTSDTITTAKGIQAANEKSYGKLLNQQHKIQQIHSHINDIYKTNVFPETDVVFNMIVDNHEKLRQDLSNLMELQTIVTDTNAHRARQLEILCEEWLNQAKDHSENLMSTAREYVGLFQNTKNSAEVAMLASSAYKNITENVELARDLTSKARETAMQSERELYPKEGESIIEKSNKSLKKSQKIHQHSLKEMEKLADLEFLLNTQRRKVDSIKNMIWQTGLRNNNLSLTLNSFSKNDTQEFLIRQIEAAKRVSEQMREVRRSAISITGSDIYKLKLKLASLEPQWAVKFGLAEENVSQSMRNIKDIKNTLSSIETTSKRNDEKFNKWNQTMSVLMQDLKNKIAKARHIADGIRVSLASKSVKCIRSFALPTLGLTTANSIKLSVALNTKLATTPILFMQGEDNRFLAIEMVKRKIRFVWNLGGDTVSITHPLELHKKDLNYDEAWYQIEANRTMNVGNLIVRQMGTGLHKPIVMQTAASQPEFTRIIFSPNKRLWIGGIPVDIRPPELLAHEDGLNAVLSNVYVDEKRIGLWSFVHSEGDCDGATLGARDITAIDNSRHFNGQGYSVVRKERSKPYKKNFFALQLTFKTLDENALLFLAIDEKNNRSISLTLFDGKIMFRIDYGGTSKLEIATTKKYNSGRWTNVEVAREFTSKRSTENGNLKVNNEEPLTGAPTTPITSALLPDLSRAVYYLGGIPPDFKSAITKAPGADNAYLGCMKDIQINGETYDPLETSIRNGVESSCRETITRAGFYGNGFLELPNHSLRKRANIGFAFRTLQSDALILLAVVPQSEIANNYYDEKDLRANYSISLVNGRLMFWADAGRGRIELHSNATLNDGEFHTVNVVKLGRKFELRVDDEYQMSKSLTQQPFVVNMIEESGGFYVGGTPNLQEYQNLVEKLRPFDGTLKDFVVNNQTISFTDLVNASNVGIGRDGPKMGRQDMYNEMLMKTEPMSKSFTATPEGCHRVGAYSYEPNAFKFGDRPQSHSIISIRKHLWQTNFDIKFDFRTFYPNGLLFFVPGTKEKQKHFFALILRNGQVNAIARGRKRMETIMSRKLNDGTWHRITLKCVNKLLTIRIENASIVGDTAIDEENLKMPRRISAANTMYVGGIADSLLSHSVELTSKYEQFKGCIRRFLMNNIAQDLAMPGRHFAIGQCFPNVEKGSYFAGDAYAIYKRIFQVGKYLELRFEFRTSEMQGVILSVAEPVGFPAISIEIHKGKIIMSCDLGDGNPFRVESNIPTKYTLCDNNWHNVSAIYDSNQIAIRVDDLPSVSKFKQHETLGKVHTKSPLYIGGLPDTAPSGTLLNRDNFKGCIRNVVIRNELKDWTDMDELHNILLSECLIMS